MSDDDVLPVEMRRLLASLRSTLPELDQGTLDRLLAGRLDQADAPPGYAGMARLVAAATPPVDQDELAGEDAALAAFAALTHSRPPNPTLPTARVPGKLVGVKAAAVVVVAALSIGGIAAAATGHLPRPARLAAERATSTSQAEATVRQPTGAASTATSAATATPPRTSPPPRPGLPVALANLTRVLTDAERRGTVDPAAADLLRQARDVVRAVQAGNGEDARKQLADLQRKTDELIAKGKISPAAEGRVRQAAAQFSRAVIRSG